MPTPTTRLGLDVTIGTDLVSAYPTNDSQAKGILDNSVLRSSGTLASRPAATAVEVDHIYHATDTKQWFMSDGSAWNVMLVAGAWVNMSLPSNWTTPSGLNAAASRVVGDKVELRGTAQNGTGAAAGLSVNLVSQFHPSAAADLVAATNQSAPSQFSVDTGGHIGQVGTPVPNNGTLTFDGLSYSL